MGVLICVGGSDAQSIKFYSSLVEDKHGAFYVFSSDQEAFTVKVEADSVWPTGAKGTVIADKNILQARAIPLSSTIDTSYEKLRDLLIDHMTSELEYIKESYKQDISNARSEFLSIKGKTFLFWEYDMPKESESVLSQQYLTTNCFDQILVLNAPVDKTQNRSSVKQFLLSTAGTIRLYNRPIEPEEFHKQLMK